MDNHTVPTPPSHTETQLRAQLAQALADRDRATANFEAAHAFCDADLEHAKTAARYWHKWCRRLAWASATWCGVATGAAAALALILAGVIG